MPYPVRPVAGLLVLLLSATTVGCGGPALAECVEVPGGRPCVEVIAEDARAPAPTRALPTVEDDGELSLADLSGKVVVVNFWASWCGPCRAEQPDLNEAHAQLAGEDVAFLGVDLQDSRANATAHIREFAIPYPSLFDPDSSYAAMFEGISPQAIPSTFVIDREGRVAVRLFGTTSAEELAAVVPVVAE